ncbi:MAG: carbohydrate kinase family protein [Bacteroidales bacterium]|nr:carbohydrate kinase family protein [Bacteroidales bacterium]
MKKALNYSPGQLLYKGIIGTGGIGTGWFFQLNGNHTLGREESRSGRFLKIHDYCKLHIILHYVRVLMGDHFRTIPIGRVGMDEPGKTLLREMENTGFIMDYVKEDSDSSTLFSFCYYYPDGTGGNLTTDNSACSKVDESLVLEAEEEIKHMGKKGIVLAVPEVPLEARKFLLQLGKKYGAFCAASFTREEIIGNQCMQLFPYADIIALNREEAFALCGKNSSGVKMDELPENCLRILRQFNPDMIISVTCGNDGSIFSDGKETSFFPACKVKAENTAGAGDAYFAGLLSGIALGLKFSHAQQLATLVAGLSVTSKDTINKGIDRDSLREFLPKAGINISNPIQTLLNN